MLQACEAPHKQHPWLKQSPGGENTHVHNLEPRRSGGGQNTCQCPKELPFPRNCEGRDGLSFNLKKTIEEGSNCHCADPCEEYGAEPDVKWKNQCECPKELPFPRNCEGRGGLSFDLKKTIKEGSSDCRCEEDPCEKYGAKIRLGFERSVPLSIRSPHTDQGMPRRRRLQLLPAPPGPSPAAAV